MSDLSLYDLTAALIAIACVVDALILHTQPTPPVSMRTRHRINQAIAKKEQDQR